MRVLLVEDEDNLRGMVEAVLKAFGHETVAVADGETAWEHCRKETFPLVLADLGLPGMSGVELVKRIRSLAQEPEPLIYVFSGQSSPPITQVLEAGADDFLPKPLGAKLLEARLDVAAWQVRKRREATLRLDLLKQVVLTVGQIQGLEMTLQVTLEEICRLTGWDVGEAWAPRDEVLRCIASWHRSAETSAIREDARSLALSRGEGLSGRCWASGQVVWSSNITAETDLAGKAGIVQSGVKCALSVPVLDSTGTVQVVLTFFVVRPEKNFEYDVALVTAIGAQLGAVLERSVATDALRRSEAENRQLLQELPLGVLVHDDCAILYANHAAVRLFETEDERELLRKAFTDFLPGDGRATFRESFWAHIQKLKPGSVVVQEMATAKGRCIFLEIVVSHSTYLGRPAILLILHDITARREGEQALRQSEERFRSIVETTRECIWASDARGRLSYVNPAIRDILGLEPQDMVGHAWREFLHPDHLAEATSQWIRCADEQKNWQGMVHKYKHADGTWKHLDSSAVPVIDSLGNLTGFWGTTRDITEKVLAERALRDKDEQLRMSQKLEALGRLAGGVAHDFNNMLTAVMGWSELALMGLPQGGKLRESLEEIVDAGKRACNLTNQLLLFSRKKVVQPVDLDLSDVFRQMGRMLQRILGEDVDLKVQLPPEGPFIRGDRGHMEQVLLNLAVNARDAMPEGGRLTITVRRLEHAEGDQEDLTVPFGNYAHISVDDTGHGMGAEVMAHVFEPFFTTKEAGRGTGLGLSTVYGIVAEGGGHIRVHSEVGRGTRFDIYLPELVRGTAVEKVEEAPRMYSGKGVVLLVEDDRKVRYVGRQMLKACGFEVLEASDGQMALDIYRVSKDDICLVITDAVMPKMNGVELADALEAENPDIKIVITSGYTDDASVLHRVRDQGLTFLPKPFRLPDLVSMLKEILGEDLEVASPPTLGSKAPS